MKKSVKVVLVVLGAILVVLLSFFIWCISVIAPYRLDATKLDNTLQTVSLYDDDGKIFNCVNKNGTKFISYEDMPTHLIQAFICAEDRKFFTHNGIDYKRVLSAAVKNVIARKWKEGGSTISQQLIKNTQLTNEKTLKRKLIEAKLTFQLEQNYTKEEIFAMYLNSIYFGHGCYGVEQAANYYFGMSAKELTTAQSAMLAGILSAPNNYSPFVNAEKCLQKRNAVLNAMYNSNVITKEQLSICTKEQLPTCASEKGVFDFEREVLYEANNLCDISSLGGVKIYTYYKPNLQEQLEQVHFEEDGQILQTNAQGGICAYVGKNLQNKRQPGSTLKPLSVYAPALEEGMISPATPILDEKVDYNGYSPQNFDKRYHGYVSAREALSQSLNVSAVKILNSIGVKRSVYYLEKLNIPLEKEDENLTLALGCLTNGITLKDLCSAYTPFLNEGNYYPCSFIKKIVDKSGKTIYSRKVTPKNVFSFETTTLLNDMLKSCVQGGTAKKMRNLPFEVCAKTGTVGRDENNTDGYNISYTSDLLSAIWLGSNSNQGSKNLTGGGKPTDIQYSLFKNIYSKFSPAPFKKSNNVVKVALDELQYNSYHDMVRADASNNFQNSTIKELFNVKYAPQKTTSIYKTPTIKHVDISVKNDKVYLSFNYDFECNILVTRKQGKKVTVIYNGKIKDTLVDEVQKNKRYTYSVTPYLNSNYGEKIILQKVFT